MAITALDVAFKVGNNAWRAVSDLFMYGMIAFGVYLLFVLIRWPIERSMRERRQRSEAAKAAAKAAEAEDDQPFGSAGNDRYGRPPAGSAPLNTRVEPRL